MEYFVSFQLYIKNSCFFIYAVYMLKNKKKKSFTVWTTQLLIYSSLIPNLYRAYVNKIGRFHHNWKIIWEILINLKPDSLKKI